MKFADLGLSEPILRAVTAEGYLIPTPIQVQAIPHVLAGRDLLGCAQTGTGKTAAFALPILHRLSAAQDEHRAHAPHGKQGAHAAPRRHRSIRALVLSPTRELAAQIGESFRAYGKHTHLRGVVIYGGVNQNRQTSALHGGTDILVATPGRLLDLMNQGHVNLGSVEVLVLDEADRMLDMGFIHDIRKIVAKVPKTRQTLFFSATMPADIRKLADNILHKPASVQVAESATADKVAQTVYHVKKRNKPLLLAHLLKCDTYSRSLVFTRTKNGANRVVRYLEMVGIPSEAIHGNKSQAARERAIHNFKSSKMHVLVATDIAARGLDIDDISHVVNYDLPNVPETYVHRIGRTARAGASGIAVSFCDADERPFLKAIEKLIRMAIDVKDEQPEYPATSESDATDRPHRAPRVQSRQPRREHAQSRSHSHGRDHTVPQSRGVASLRRGRAGQAAPAARRDHADRSGAAADHGRREQTARPAGTERRESPPKHGAPAPAGPGQSARGRGKFRRGGRAGR